MVRVLAACLGIAVLTLIVMAPARTHAQAGTMTIEVPASVDTLVAGDVLGRLAVFADGQHCTTVDVSGGADIVLGVSGQPAACSTPGAEVTFVDGFGRWLFVTTTIEPGATFTLMNWAPHPPHTSYPGYICAYLAEEGIAAAACAVASPGTPSAWWAFAQRMPFADERAAMAFVLLMDTDSVVASTADLGVTGLAYGAGDIAQSAAAAAGDELLLLAAAGLTAGPGGPLQATEARRCLIWVPASGDQAQMFAAVARALGAELARVLVSLGVAAQPCSLTDDPAAADLFVWPLLGPRPASLDTPNFDAGFLTLTAAQAPPGGVPVPAAGGMQPVAGDGSRALAIAGLLLALSFALAARTLVGRRP